LRGRNLININYPKTRANKVQGEQRVTGSGLVAKPDFCHPLVWTRALASLIDAGWAGASTSTVSRAPCSASSSLGERPQHASTTRRGQKGQTRSSPAQAFQLAHDMCSQGTLHDTSRFAAKPWIPQQSSRPRAGEGLEREPRVREGGHGPQAA
jgi:hypothetical protein